MSTSSHQPIDWPQLGRYLAGECPKSEAEEVRRWLEAEPARAEVAASMKSMWDAWTEFPAVDEDAGWRSMRARIAGLETEPRRRFTIAPIGRQPRLLFRVAAAVLLLIGAGFVAHAALRTSYVAPPTQSWREVATARGQRATVQLGDGISVLLGVASKLRYQEPFLGGTRTVQLEGEAYFDVTHDERRRFIVHARDLVAEDMGTEFVVRAYADDKHGTVAVREGVVQIAAIGGGDASRGAILEAGRQGYISPNGTPIVEPADTIAAFAWTQGRLEFTHTPLSVVLSELARWYDVDFEVRDAELGAKSITLTVRSDALEHVVEGIALLINARHERRGRIVTFTAKSRTS